MNKAEWRMNHDAMMGWCPACEDWTRDCTEPDVCAEDAYECPVCGGHVLGAESALECDALPGVEEWY